MEKIIITPKTRNTKKLRLKIYKAALEHITNMVTKHGRFHLGFCRAIICAIKFDDECMPSKQFEFDLYYSHIGRSVYKELLRYKPFEPGVFWFATNDLGDAKRIAILEVIIEEMSK